MRVATTSHDTASQQELANRRELLFFLAYTFAYVGYLFGRLENEAGHWISLVLLPVGLIWALRKRNGLGASAGDVLASVGLRKDWTLGLGWAFLLGALLSSLQLILSRNRGAIMETLLTGRGLLLLPVAFLLMLVMAGFTEEFFFRGVLQTRLSACTRSNLVAVLSTSVLFGLYHLPYAYLNPRWPSHGDWVAALGAAFGQAIPAGIILGTLYAKRPNLLACVVVHAMINLLPVAAMLAGKR
jgi:membrane protease YdiL (CAAX protease family)